MTFSKFVGNVQDWQRDKGIYEHSTPLAQALKAVSEVGELADAVIKGDRDALKDAIGDVMVCLVGVAKMTGCDIEVRPLIEKDVPQNNQALAALAAYYVSDLATALASSYISDVCVNIAGFNSGERLSISILDSIYWLNAIAVRCNLTLIECCESAWHEIKDRKGRMVEGGAFVKDETPADAQQSMGQLHPQHERVVSLLDEQVGLEKRRAENLPTLKDQFAMSVLPAVYTETYPSFTDMAEACYRLADAMLVERKKNADLIEEQLWHAE